MGIGLMEANLTVSDNSFEFRFKDYAVMITLGKCEDILIEDTGTNSPNFHYKDDGRVYGIT